MRCPNPQCQSQELVIDTQVSARVFLSPYEHDPAELYVYEISYGDHDWTDEDGCECLDCHFSGKVADFRIEETPHA